MKLKIQTKKLSEALAIVGAIGHTPASSNLPILASVLIESRKGGVLLRTSNLDLWITRKEDAEVEVEGSVCISLSLLRRFVAATTSSETKMELSGNMLKVSLGDSQADFESLPAEEFPTPLEVNSECEFQCEAEEFLNPLRAVSHCVSEDKSRYVLTGVAIQTNGKGIEFAATNASALSICKSSLAGKVNAILPDGAIKAILSSVSSGDVKATIGSGGFILSSPDVEICGRLIEGAFPNYRQVIPELEEKAFSCNREELLSAIARAAIFLERNPGIYLEGKGKEVEVGCSKARTRLLRAEFGKQPAQRVILNHRYLSDALKAMSGETVRIELSKPIAIREGDAQHFIQPMIAPEA